MESAAKTIRVLGEGSGTDTKSRKRPRHSQLWKQNRQKLKQLNNKAERSSEVSDTVTESFDDSFNEDLLRIIKRYYTLVGNDYMSAYEEVDEALSYRFELKDDKSTASQLLLLTRALICMESKYRAYRMKNRKKAKFQLRR